jgi:uncharacterized membrane protein YkvA (DUF1232 family)
MVKAREGWKTVADQDKKSSLGPMPWGTDPIKGLNYDYLDIDAPAPVEPPKAVVPRVVEYNAVQAQDFYQRTRAKIVKWAQGAGAGKATANYILLIPDLMALIVRLMADPRVSATLKAEIAAASAYVIIPVDLLPEAVLGPAGLIDDAIVAVYALNRVVKVMGQAGEDVLRQYWDGDDDILFVIQDLLNKADQFVTGKVWAGIKKFMSEAGGKQEGSGPIVEGSARPIVPPDK